MGLKVKTEPLIEPVTDAEAEVWIRYTDTLQKAAISSLVKAARKEVESWTNRILINTVFEYYQDRFTRELILPVATVQSSGLVITYQDNADVEQTVLAADYGLDNVSSTNKIFQKRNGSFWPTDVIQEPNAVKVTFTAGYGVLAADVPEDAKTVIKLLVSFMFDNRDSYNSEEFKANPAVRNLLNNIASYRF